MRHSARVVLHAFPSCTIMYLAGAAILNEFSWTSFSNMLQMKINLKIKGLTKIYRSSGYRSSGLPVGLVLNKNGNANKKIVTIKNKNR